MVLGFDFVATLLFALEGAILAATFHLDLLGVLVVGFTTALGGGIIRDVLLGATPPAALAYRRYAIAAVLGGAVVALFAQQARQIPEVALVALDAAALSSFMASGTRKAIDFRTNYLTAVLLGAVTAVGGGVLRDLLLNRVPVVLVADFYASAAIVGGVVIVIGLKYQQPAGRMMVIGAVTCFGLRMLGYWQHWSLPTF